MKPEPSETKAGPLGQLKAKSAKAYCDYIEQMRQPECLGFEAKIKKGVFSKAELDAHCRASWLLGRHRAFGELLQESQSLEAAQTVNQEMLTALQEIIEDLPNRRDWLDPVLEKRARSAIARAESEPSVSTLPEKLAEAARRIAAETHDLFEGWEPKDAEAEIERILDEVFSGGIHP